MSDTVLTLPETIRIGYRDFTIIAWDPLEAADRGLAGLCEKHDARISVRRDMSPEEMANTLLHEVLHAVYWIGACDDAREEKLVAIFSNILCQVWRDNPDFVAYIDACFGGEASNGTPDENGDLYIRHAGDLKGTPVKNSDNEHLARFAGHRKPANYITEIHEILCIALGLPNMYEGQEFSKVFDFCLKAIGQIKLNNKELREQSDVAEFLGRRADLSEIGASLELPPFPEGAATGAMLANCLAEIQKLMNIHAAAVFGEDPQGHEEFIGFHNEVCAALDVPIFAPSKTFSDSFAAGLEALEALKAEVEDLRAQLVEAV